MTKAAGLARTAAAAAILLVALTACVAGGPSCQEFLNASSQRQQSIADDKAEGDVIAIGFYCSSNPKDDVSDLTG